MDIVASSSPFVRVYIWEHSSFRKSVNIGNIVVQGPSPGHVSLEVHTGGIEDRITYISFWPSTNRDCCPETLSHFHTCYQVDADYEKKVDPQYNNKDPAHVDLTIGQEGIKKIQAAFEQFKKAPYEWTLTGSGVLGRPYESNCAGLSLYLLEQGGLGGLGSTRSFLRSAIATAVSSYLFFSASLFCYRQVTPLLVSFSHCLRFGRIYTDCALSGFAARTTLEDVLPQALELSQTMESKATSDLVALSKTTVKEMAQAIVGLEDSQNEFVSLAPLIAEDYYFIRRRIFFAGAAMLCPVALTTTLAFQNQKMWVQTITPADVKQHAMEVENHSKTGASPTRWKKHQWQMLGIAAGAIVGFYFAKRHNR
jgi:hypothetical protein